MNSCAFAQKSARFQLCHCVKVIFLSLVLASWKVSKPIYKLPGCALTSG